MAYAGVFDSRCSILIEDDRDVLRCLKGGEPRDHSVAPAKAEPNPESWPYEAFMHRDHTVSSSRHLILLMKTRLDLDGFRKWCEVFK